MEAKQSQRRIIRAPELDALEEADPPARLMSTAELSEYLGGSPGPRALIKWRREGRGPRYAKMGALVRYDIRDVNRWLEERKYQSTSEYKGDE